MTKAISDVDDCVEGMRKFTTEVFDTGVALVGYMVMLLVYDWRLALLSLLFTPVSYVCAARMKKPVQRAGAAYKKAAGALSTATLDRAQNAVTYRIYGCEDARAERYEDTLKKLRDRRRAQQRAAVGAAAAVSGRVQRGRTVHTVAGRKKRSRYRMEHLGHCGVHHVSFLLYQADGEILQGGEAVQLGAEGGGLMEAHSAADEKAGGAPGTGYPGARSGDAQRSLSFAYGDEPVFSGLSITALPGDIIGVTGPVACGKSTFGRVFLCEAPYGGSAKFGPEEFFPRLRRGRSPRPSGISATTRSSAPIRCAIMSSAAANRTQCRISPPLL